MVHVRLCQTTCLGDFSYARSIEALAGKNLGCSIENAANVARANTFFLQFFHCESVAPPTSLGIEITGSFLQGFLLAVGLCVAASVPLWFVIERLEANQIIAGLGLTGLGLGGTAFAVEAYMDSKVAVTVSFGAPKAGPAFGTFGVLSVFVLLMSVVVFGLWALLRCTRFGLRPGVLEPTRPAYG